MGYSGGHRCTIWCHNYAGDGHILVCKRYGAMTMKERIHCRVDMVPRPKRGVNGCGYLPPTPYEPIRFYGAISDMVIVWAPTAPATDLLWILLPETPPLQPTDGWYTLFFLLSVVWTVVTSYPWTPPFLPFPTVPYIPVPTIAEI